MEYRETRKLKTLLTLAVLMLSMMSFTGCEPDLSEVETWKGDHNLKSLKRDDGSTIRCDEPRFSTMWAMSDEHLKEVLKACAKWHKCCDSSKDKSK